MSHKERARRAMDDILTWQAGIRGGYQVRTESAADIIEMALAAVERETLERAVEICMNTWRTAPNDRASDFRQNAISHGCIAAADAIKATIQEQKFTEKGRLLDAQETERRDEGQTISREAEGSPALPRQAGETPDPSTSAGELGGLRERPEVRRQGDGANHSGNAVASKDWQQTACENIQAALDTAKDSPVTGSGEDAGRAINGTPAPSSRGVESAARPSTSQAQTDKQTILGYTLNGDEWLSEIGIATINSLVRDERKRINAEMARLRAERDEALRAPTATQAGFDPEMGELILTSLIEVMEGKADFSDVSQYTDEIYDWRASLKARPGGEKDDLCR
jgi:hypothetical protein